MRTAAYPPELMAKFWAKVITNPLNGCWEWMAFKDRLGYGRYNIKGVTSQLAHRTAYEIVFGSIPDDLPLDHLCRNPSCVNPAHLEPVTNAENLRRGAAHRRKIKNAMADPMVQMVDALLAEEEVQAA